MRRLAAPVLIFEAIVLVLAIPVALTIEDADPAVVAAGAGVLIVAAVALAGMLRHRWAYVAASVLQLLIVASGMVVPAMFVLGTVFAALWVVSLWLGSRSYQTSPDQID